MPPRPRGRPAEADGGAIEDSVLLDAVLRAFGEQGFDGTSVREVARELGVSHNLLPQRFGSKQVLWYAAVDYGFGRLGEDLAREADLLGDDDVTVLRGLVTKFIAVNADHPSLLQIINQEAAHPGPRLDYLFETYIQPVRDFGQTWLDRLAAEGKISQNSVTLLYFLMTHGAGGVFALPGLSGRLMGDTSALKADQIAQAVDMIFDGLLSRP
ncbi:MAG: TetR/AcrR family transcriptional regulator [Alphaproteobacteria bacterium]